MYFYKSSILILVLLSLSGCTTLEGLESLKDAPSTYKADMIIDVDAQGFDGFASTVIGGEKIIRVFSYAKLDYLFAHTCGRHAEKTEIDKNWTKISANEFEYKYRPVGSELSGCPIIFEAYDLGGIVAWGMVVFRGTDDLPATTYCNGRVKPFRGHTACQTKAGIEQTIIFTGDKEIKFKGRDNCEIKQVSPQEFKFRPQGWCTAVFTDGERFHKLTALGYKRPYIREK